MTEQEILEEIAGFAEAIRYLTAQKQAMLEAKEKAEAEYWDVSMQLANANAHFRTWCDSLLEQKEDLV